MAAPHGQAQLLATPSGSHPQAATPTQAPEKGKSKAKSKAATGVQPSPAAAGTAVAGGSIGVAGTDPHPPGGLTAGGGARRPLPELVLPFPLPVSRSRGSCPTKEGKEDKGQGRQPSSVGRSQKGSPHDAPAVRKGRGNLASKGVSSEEEEEEGEEEDDSEDMSEDEDEEAALAREEERRRKKVPASIEKSLVLLQSLRQSRLAHLYSLLPAFSQRTRSGMLYPNVVPISLLNGLDPRAPHILIQLGRADVHVGPHTFVKTKFWEIRPDLPMLNASRPSPHPPPLPFSPPQEAPAQRPPIQPHEAQAQRPPAPPSPHIPPFAPPPNAMPQHVQFAPPRLSSASPNDWQTQHDPRPPSQVAASIPSSGSGSSSWGRPSAAPGPATGTAPSAPARPAPQNIAPRPNTGLPPPGHGNTPQPPPNSRGSGAPRPPVPQQGPAAIDAVLVSRVNACAALNPPLQELLHIAASGRADGEQLRMLGVWIQAITNQLREDEARAAAGQGPPPTAGVPGRSQVRSNPGDKQSPSRGAPRPSTPNTRSPVVQGAGSMSPPPISHDMPQTPQVRRDSPTGVTATTSSGNLPSAAGPAPPPNRGAVPGPRSRFGPLPWPHHYDNAPRPPLIVIEYRENQSSRFILPLWRTSVERRGPAPSTRQPDAASTSGITALRDSKDGCSQTSSEEPELILSFFLPALGSEAAGTSGLERAESDNLDSPTAKKAPAKGSKNGIDRAVLEARGSAGTNPESPQLPNARFDQEEPATPTPAVKRSHKKAGTQKVQQQDADIAVNEPADSPSAAPKPAPDKKHERYPVTWRVRGEVSESMWEAFGRVPGCITRMPDGKTVREDCRVEKEVADRQAPGAKPATATTEDADAAHKALATSFLELLAQMPERHHLKVRVPPARIPRGLEEHLSDKFAVRIQVLGSRPLPKRKVGGVSGSTAALVEDEMEWEGITGTGPRAAGLGEATPPRPPKRKRHVALHNPDGTRKSCGACGRTRTPMWRRGPKGPSTLCNACGARWKAGRLVVPEKSPPPIFEPGDEDYVAPPAPPAPPPMETAASTAAPDAPAIAASSSVPGPSNIPAPVQEPGQFLPHPQPGAFETRPAEAPSSVPEQPNPSQPPAAFTTAPPAGT